MSLRTRLIAALIVLAAAGLVTLAAVTYAEQRSFLLDRVDQQARDAQRAVNFELWGPDGGPGAPPGVALRLPPPPLLRGVGVRGQGPPPDEGGSGPQGLPRGTVGQLRTPLGRVVRSTSVRSYGEGAPPAPKPPSSIPLDKPIIVDSQGGSGLRYRVLAEPTHDHPRLTTVVA